jgi:hypothetical protein
LKAIQKDRIKGWNNKDTVNEMEKCNKERMNKDEKSKNTYNV